MTVLEQITIKLVYINEEVVEMNVEIVEDES